MLAFACPSERRPVALRQWTSARRLAGWLAARGVTANTISFVGLLFGLSSGLALAATRHPVLERPAFFAAALLILLRLLANMLDGMVALAAGQSSPVGELWNEVPDRLSDVATLLGAGYAAGSEPVFGFQAACLALLVAYVRAEGKVAGAPQIFCGPMAKPQRMFTVAAAAGCMALAPAGWRPFASGPGLMSLALLVVGVGCAGTVVRRLGRIRKALTRKAP
jgi:phosphatidylglycerophosphate synthase